MNLFQADSDSESVHDTSSDGDIVKDENDNNNEDHKLTAVKREQEMMRYGMTSGLVVEGEGAVVDEDIMTTWLEQVWFRHVPPTNFLLADSYHVHTAHSTQKILLEVNISYKLS